MMNGGASPIFFQIDPSDNVATALEDMVRGTAKITGGVAPLTIDLLEPIKKGHKVALAAIDPNASIIKYGVVIARAKRQIQPGEWVHLHNCESLYDHRSSELDIETGAPHDTKYE